MLFREIIVDNFAGGGGTSTGFFNATGRHVDIAINHDPVAIAMHEANHPETEHYCESVWEVDPREAVKGRPVALCWLSPDCTHFSKARSGKPVSKKIRGLAWVAVRWAATVKPRVIMLENVEEFQTWGPIVDGKPCPKNKGKEFRVFVNALKRQGYKVEWKELRACDFGAPTIRKRLFMIARRDGQPIVWPKQTHGDPDSRAVKNKKLKPYRAASECIDWSEPCHSIFLTKEEGKKVGVKRPLVENTMKRIYKGLQKFVIENKDPFFISTYYGPQKDGKGYLRGSGINEPIGTITSGGLRHALVAPYLTEHANGSHQRVFDTKEPLRTQMASVKGGHFALVAPFMTKFNTGAVGYGINEPTHTVTAGGKQARPGTANTQGIIACNLVKHYGGGYNGNGNDVKKPLSTVTTTDHNALVSSHLIKMRNNNYGSHIDNPMHTITSGGLHMGEVRAFLVKYYGTATGTSLKEPMHTIVNKDRFGLVTVKGQDYIVADIGMRMLQPRELYRAQGFPDDYIIDPKVNGKKITKSQQVAKCGNSVPPQFSEALIKANLPELCIGGKDKFAS